MQARARQIPVVLASRVHTGRLIPLYARDAEASALGVIRADNLSAQKARVLLMLALTRTKDVSELQRHFDR
jgi:L-asparaginase